jgi:hypothetical protein
MVLRSPVRLGRAIRLSVAAARDTVRADVPSSERGVALLVVLITVAVMGALSTEFAYNTRTNIWMAGNVTSDTQAFYHARSATEIATLAVNAKRNFPQMKAALSLMGKGGGAKLEIWRQACEFVKIFSTGKASFFGLDILDLTQEEAVGVKKGVFTCEVSAEDSRANLNAAASDPPHMVPNVGKKGRPSRKRANGRDQLGLKLYGLFRPFLESGEFDSEDELVEVIANIMDWTDSDETKTDIGPDGRFIDSGAAESTDYGAHGYDSKNARMDTVGEVQLIEGMPSDVYCKIRDSLTVFSTGKLNVNDADLGTLKGVLCEALPDDAMKLLMCWNILPGQIAPMDEALIALETCRDLKKAAYSTPFTNMNQFVQFFQKFPGIIGDGTAIPINSRLVKEHLGVMTTMVRISSHGGYGRTKREHITVIDLASGATVYSHIN